MDFLRAIVVGLKEKYFCFSGRASQSEHNYFFLFSILISIVLALYDLLLRYSYGFLPVIVVNLSFIVSLALICPQTGMIVRRLHDTDYSAWCLLAPIAPLVGLSFLAYRISPPAGQDASFAPLVLASGAVIGFAIGQIWLLYLLVFKKGDEGENRFGSVPE